MSDHFDDEDIPDVGDGWDEFRYEDQDPIRLSELAALDLATMPEDVQVRVLDDYFPDASITRVGDKLVCHIEDHMYTKYWEHRYSAYAFAEAMERAIVRLTREGHPFANPERDNDDVHIFVRWDLILSGDTSALEVGEQATKHQPDAMSWFQVAIAREGTRDIEGCMDAYRRALDLDPDYAAAMFNLGGILWNSGDRHGAIDIWSTALDAIEVNPADIAGNGLVAGGGCALNVDWSQLPVGCGVWWNGSALEVAHDEIAGRGLVIGSGCAIDVAVGCGLRLGSGDAVEVNPADLAGDGLARSASISRRHGSFPMRVRRRTSAN